MVFTILLVLIMELLQIKPRPIWCLDSNNNSTFDDGDINVTTLASTIDIVPTVQKYEYDLSTGFNFISLPFLIKDPEYRTAASLLKKLNEVYGDRLYSIAKYDSSWKVVTQNVEIFDNSNFQLLPGQGYIIKAKEDLTISLMGQPIKYESPSDNAPVTLYPGWNLVAVYGTKSQAVYSKIYVKQDINFLRKLILHLI